MCLYRDICQWHRHLHTAAQAANDKVCSERSCLPCRNCASCTRELVSHTLEERNQNRLRLKSHCEHGDRKGRNGKRYISWTYCVSLFIDVLSSPFKHTRVISSPSPSALREKWLNFPFFNAGISDWIKIRGAWGYGAAEWCPIMALKRGTCIINHPSLSYPWRTRQGNPCLSERRQ